MKSIFALITTFLIILSFPQNAFAEYYNRKGEVIPPTPPASKVVQNQPPKLPYGVGVSPKDRRNSTNSYNYIIENQCKTLAVNLYRGETLYSCSNGIKFWSDISIEPFIMVKNRNKVDDEAFDDAVVYSSVIMMN